MPSFSSSEHTVYQFNDFDYFTDFEKEFPTIAYNDDLTSKFDFSPEPTVSPQHIDEFDETSLSEYDEDLSKYLLASLAISPFHDDPYMKVMQAYNATSNESPIPPPQALIAPPTVLPLSLKRARFLPSPSNSALPQVFEIGESFHKTSLERHEEQIMTILNHLDELPLERIDQVEEKIEGLGNGRMRHNDVIVLARVKISTLEMINEDIQNGSQEDINICRTSYDSGHHQELVADSVVVALEAQADTMENTNNTNRNTEQKETLVARKCSYKDNCIEDYKVKFATGTLTEEVLSWWNSFTQPIGIEEAYKITFSEFKNLLIKKYCPRTNVKKMEDEFYNLTVKGNDLKTYVKRFQELAVLSPTMVPNSDTLMEVFIGGLPRSIEGNVTASKPQTLEEAITINQRLMDQNRRQETLRAYTATPTENSRLVPLCFAIFDLEPLSLSFDFVISSEIFKSLSFSLDHHCHLAFLCLDQHAHTLHCLESLLTISFDRLDILKEDLVYQS
uniref:Reverse transcriptase domain-containing protein n=1 Tax=Tanacetum cinerariifolium TaxID=118510 RepID=A0A6L2L3L7_TANCI|nr:reverse transcriptase domain-containing protein [Tanacetum cinerariifolium]